MTKFERATNSSKTCTNFVTDYPRRQVYKGRYYENSMPTIVENEPSKEDAEEINSKKREYYSKNCKEEIACGNQNDENIFNLEIVYLT